MVKSIFNQANDMDAGPVTRAQVREALEHHTEQFSSLQSHLVPASNPIIHNLLKQLESSSSGNLTKNEVMYAIKDAAELNHIVLNNQQIVTAVDSVFSSGLFENVDGITRS